MTLLQEQEQQEPSQPKRPQGHNCRYVKGFKYCRSCEIWVRAGEEKRYDNDDEKNKNKERAHCPQCNRFLKTRPRSTKAKERFAEITTGYKLRRY